MSDACVYKIECNNDDINDIYIGSTLNFYMRRAQHKHQSQYNVSTFYKFIRDNGGWENWTMSIVKADGFENKQQLIEAEREMMENETRPLLNKKRACRTDAERIQQIIESRRRTAAKWNAKHREKVECEMCGKMVSYGNVARHRRRCEKKTIT